METTGVIVQRAKGQRWTPEQKMALLQEWQQGTPIQEVCRRHGLQTWQMYKWRKALERGLADHGALVPKSQVAALQRKVEDLEKALGRKSLEVDVLKKFFELKGLRLPEGI